MTIKTVHKLIRYLDGGDRHAFELRQFQFMLFRQDFEGSERVYFDEADIDQIIEDIESGDLPIHHNYSILYCRDQAALDAAPDLGCYATLAQGSEKQVQVS